MCSHAAAAPFVEHSHCDVFKVPVGIWVVFWSVCDTCLEFIKVQMVRLTSWLQAGIRMTQNNHVFIPLMHADKDTHKHTLCAQCWVTNLQSPVNNSADQKHAPIINLCTVCLVPSNPHARLKYSQRGLGLGKLEFDSRCVIYVFPC